MVSGEAPNMSAITLLQIASSLSFSMAWVLWSGDNVTTSCPSVWLKSSTGVPTERWAAKSNPSRSAQMGGLRSALSAMLPQQIPPRLPNSSGGSGTEAAQEMQSDSRIQGGDLVRYEPWDAAGNTCCTCGAT